MLLTGLDYFGARYFSAAQGRFTTPDWSAIPQAVPFARLGDPQTLNLYQYTRNNPLRFRDRDGHTHQECDPDTYSTDKDKTITVTAHCHDVSDWWNIWTNFQNWRKKTREDWDKRIIAHQPPPDKRYKDNLLTDINNIMMGMVPVWGTWDRLGEALREPNGRYEPRTKGRVASTTDR